MSPSYHGGNNTHDDLSFPHSSSFFTAPPLPADPALPPDPECHTFSALPTHPPGLSGPTWLPLTIHIYSSRKVEPSGWVRDGTMGVGPFILERVTRGQVSRGLLPLNPPFGILLWPASKGVREQWCLRPNTQNTSLTAQDTATAPQKGGF